MFREPAATAPFCEKIGIDAGKFAALVGSSHVGEAADHCYKKLTRRILGPRPVSAYLSPRVVAMAKTILRRSVPATKTIVSDANAARISAFYAGQRVEDLNGLTLGSVII